MYAEVNGAELYYERLGEGNDPAIMALHGGPGVGDHRKPKQAFEPLTDEYEVVVYDHRGCGQSADEPPYSNAQYAKDANALREQLDLGEVVLIGGSYGGFVTQEYVTRFPETVTGFVLRDTAPTGEYDEQARTNARADLPEVWERNMDVPEISFEEFDRVMDGRARSNEEFRKVFHGILPLYAPTLEEFDPAAARDRIEDIYYHYETHNALFSEEYPTMDYRDDLSDVTVPALVTVGRLDWITPVAASVELADLLPNSRLVIFESSGHSPNLDQKSAYIRRVREFLDTIGFGGERQ
jgi:proline iminopeptidase